MTEFIRLYECKRRARLGKWVRIISASIKNDQFPKRAYKSAWGNYKSFKAPTKRPDEEPRETAESA
jgi:hypothetical protein